MAASTRTPAKKKTTKKNKGLGQVTFADDIPKIEREVTKRKSKYDTLLEKIQEVATKTPEKSVAVLKFDAQGKATSRYTSVKTAVEKREDAHQWTVAVRTHDEDDVRLYIKWDPEAEESDDEDPEAETEEEEEEQEDDEEFLDF